ncbi:MAG: hypothetical protein JOZ72_14055 [Alphaproteobacteria bacterium]|nr:hypothetical protein [Alphaproteobacteria bacterium]
MRLVWISFFAWFAAGSAAQAAFAISDSPTQNVQCRARACTATARVANLNAAELAGRLESGNIKLIANQDAQDIRIEGSVSFTSGSLLNVMAYRSIIIGAPLTVMGPGAVILNTGGTDTGGVLQFAGRGRISFADSDSTLTIDAKPYRLAFDLATLASNVAAEPHGFHALANDYDASADGVYASAPVATNLTGTFDGLGNTIRLLRIKSTAPGAQIGLFSDAGAIRNLHIERAAMSGGPNSSVGGIAANCHVSVSSSTVSGRISGAANSSVGGICGMETGGFITRSHSTAAVTGRGTGGFIGGLVGHNFEGHIQLSYATGVVRAGKNWIAGGLAGHHEGQMEDSFASGAVIADDGALVGGLIGDYAGGTIFDNYANGQVVGGVHSTVGGLIGQSNGDVASSYSSGAVASGSGNAVGGFVGIDQGILAMTDDYWDIDTSGQNHSAGNDPNDVGITGLTTAEFQSGLPSGFRSTIWAEDPTINNGLPYLRANVPPR